MPSTARKHQLSQSLVFHAYNRSNNGIPIFHRENDFKYFVHLLKRYKNRFNISIYHWVIMHNHYHILFEIADPLKIPSLMAGLNRAYTHYHHPLYTTSGLLWQGRFGLQPIQKETYLIACGRYIERNPVRANLVPIAQAYPYSSASFYCNNLQDTVTTEDPLFSQFGPTPQQRNSHYARFLTNFNADEEKLFRNRKKAVGDDYFKRRLQRIHGRLMPRHRGKPPELFSM
jgi:putative transposase